MNLREEISRIAYELFESRGCVHGYDLNDWLEAERIVLGLHAGQEIEEPEDIDLSEEMAAVEQEELELQTKPQ
ncbi:MAG: DUF2934 domain-containing protein [Nitrospirae bacterium]|nr:DUF2934 domain-containing protein [Nitrospirota bacterium]